MRLERAPEQRFSDRAAAYVRGRPGYPASLLEVLRERCDLKPSSVVADVGAGTGILSRLLRESGCDVRAVEPNAAMREAAGLPMIAGTAEATTLPDASIDLVTAAQAFHWFDRARARVEFARILKPGGWVAVIWNDRRLSTPFGAEYERFIRAFGTDYAGVAARDVMNRTDLEAFLGKDYFEASLDNPQVLDREGFRYRVLSASYMPAPGHPKHADMLEAMEALFLHYQEEGWVVMDQDTRLYAGRLG